MTIVQHITLALDLGDTNTEVCALDGSRRIVEQGSLATNRESLTALFKRYGDATVVFEVGSQSRWVQRLAKEHCRGQVIAADPRQLHLISKSLNKSDKGDAYLLARAGQGLPELLHPVEHRSEPAHQQLSVLRARDSLVRVRTQLITQIRGMVKAAGEKLPTCDADGFFRKALEHVPAGLQDVCAPLFATLAAIHEQLLVYKRKIREMVQGNPVAQRLMKIPSVGAISALTFVLTIDDPARIRGCRNVGAYLGMAPKKKESGDSSPQLGITKAGDVRMRRLLVLCAHHLLSRGQDCRLKRWGLELCRRGGRNAKKRAVVAVARKLSVQMLSIWRSGQDYDHWRDAPKDMLMQLS